MWQIMILIKSARVIFEGLSLRPKLVMKTAKLQKGFGIIFPKYLLVVTLSYTTYYWDEINIEGLELDCIACGTMKYY